MALHLEQLGYVGKAFFCEQRDLLSIIVLVTESNDVNTLLFSHTSNKDDHEIA